MSPGLNHLSMGTTLGEEPAGPLRCGFAFAFDRYPKPFMRNSNPGVSIVSAQRPNSNLVSMFTMQTTGRNFQRGSNFCVSLDPFILL